MKIYLATWLEANQGVTLSAMDYKERLISYYFLKAAKSIGDIESYITTGIFPGAEKEGNPYEIKERSHRRHAKHDEYEEAEDRLPDGGDEEG
jgi:hypothetical protein